MLSNAPVKIERWRPEEANASTYALDDRIIIQGESLTSIGCLISGPHIRLEGTVSNSDLGVALLRVLAEAKIMPVPTDLKAEMQKLLQTAGVRSWSKLTYGDYCALAQKAGVITIVPGGKDGRAIAHMPELQVCISETVAPEEVGKALRDGFRRSREETA